MAGPGESQLEIDRRLIADRIQKIKADLAKVVAGRNVQRRGRLQSELPTVALVGYTNSGKSTLFNRLTKTQSFAHDMVFATLDPTIRRVRLAGSQPEEPAVNILLSDTVGFIRDIPTQLIAAFQATLEEVVHADLLLHVYDASSVEAPRRIASVMATLNQLFSGRDLPLPPLWLVANKADLLPGGALLDLPAGAQNRDAPILVSALTGQGCALLLQALWDELAAKRLVKSG
jgi:GTP-binding protein HflX